MSKPTVNSHIIDEYCKINGTLLEHNDKVYSCILNQTDIDANKNKFYIMQLIKTISNVTLHIRFGRIGTLGCISTKQYSSESEGRLAFEKQFRSKTGNQWSVKDFIKKEGKYFMSQVSYENELKNIKDIPITIPNSTLDEKTQKLISMLSDVNMMQNALISLDIDTKKLPLGKINQHQLDQANEVLDKILDIINQLTKKKDDDELKYNLMKLSSEYYTYVPISCGRRKPPIIESSEILEKYRETIDELSNMVINVQVTNNIKVGENPIDSVYKGINTKINPLDKNNKIWDEIIKYVKNTHGTTHKYKLEVLEIFEIEQDGKKKCFDEYSKNINNHTLLFHGSGMSNWISILKNDLLLNPRTINKKVVISGRMFSEGIYFANAITKSFGYCRTETSQGIACLAIAEVPLGKISKRTQADYYITKKSLKKENCDSIQGLGQYSPSSSVVVDNIIIPNGKLIDTKMKRSLLYDEFIVYDSNQQFIKYLILVKNTLK